MTVQPENFEKQLIPSHIVNELTLELFDIYRNYLRGKDKVQFTIKGFGKPILTGKNEDQLDV